MAGPLERMESFVTRHPKLFGAGFLFGAGLSVAQIAMGTIAPDTMNQAFELLATGLNMTAADASVLAVVAPTATGLALTASGGFVLMANDVRRWISGERQHIEDAVTLDSSTIHQSPDLDPQRDYSTYRGADLARYPKREIAGPKENGIGPEHGDRFQ